VIERNNKPATKSRGSVNSNNSFVYYHFVFRTYKGKHILTDRPSVDFLYKAFVDISKIKGFDLIACKVLGDHVHCLLGFDPKHRPDYVIRMIKGISSRDFFLEFKTNRLVYRKLWGRGYFEEQISPDKFNTVVRYIENQTNSSGLDKRFAQEPRVSLAGS